MRLSAALGTSVLAAFLCGNVDAAEESERPETSFRLPAEYAANYIVAADSLSPDGKFAIIIPKGDPDAMSPRGKDHLAALEPFAILGTLDTESPYFEGQSHGGLTAEWSEDSSVALVTLASKWGPGDVFLLELRDGKLTRMTNLLAKVHDLLLPDYRKAKPQPARYNEYFDFIFESEDPVCMLDGGTRVQINADATNDPKGVLGRRWNAHIAATWDIAAARFTDHKITPPPKRR